MNKKDIIHKEDMVLISYDIKSSKVVRNYRCGDEWKNLPMTFEYEVMLGFRHKDNLMDTTTYVVMGFNSLEETKAYIEWLIEKGPMVINYEKYEEVQEYNLLTSTQ